MTPRQKEICKTLQILLWIWFGLVTSFCATNVVNIAKLETQIKETNTRIDNIENRLLLLENGTNNRRN
jgi:hypothetical protein